MFAAFSRMIQIQVALVILWSTPAYSGVVDLFIDKSEWESSVGNFTTIDFAQFANFTPISNQYSHLGVNFEGSNFSHESAGYLNDDFGLWGPGGTWVHFDQPMNWIAVDHPGSVHFALYNDGELIGEAAWELHSGLGNFSGLVSAQPFDLAYLFRPISTDPSDNTVFIDDLHFGALVPAPGALGVLGLAFMFRRRRRRTTPYAGPPVRARGLAHRGSCRTSCAALLAALAIGDTVGRAAVDAPCDDWNATPGQPGMNHIVRALETFNGELYAGGSFTMAGGEQINYIARWNENTAQWDDMNGGVNARARDLIVYDGNLVTAGSFSTAGGQTVNALAAWDGEQWQSIGPGVQVNFGTRALALYEGDLIVAGSFQYTGDGLQVNYIARWDGEQWHSMGGGFGFLSTPRTLAVHNGDVYAGGAISVAGGVPVNKLTRWDGAQWHDVGGGVHGPGSTVDALISYNGDLIVAGQFDAVGPAGATTPANHIARWDGENWHPMGSGINYWVRDLVIYQDTLIAAGHFTTAEGNEVNHIMWWDIDSEQWQPLGNGVGTNHFIQSLGVYNGSLVMGGFFTEAGGEEANYIAMWTGCLGNDVSIPGDLNGDGVVNVSDLLLLLGEWGECPGEGACPADLNSDGVVDVVDLLLMLGEWG